MHSPDFARSLNIFEKLFQELKPFFPSNFIDSIRPVESLIGTKCQILCEVIIKFN